MKNPMSLAMGTTALVVLGLGAMSLVPREGHVATPPEQTQSVAGQGDQQQVADSRQEQKDQHEQQAQPVSDMKWQVYDKGIDTAKASKKYVLVQYFATWCGYCRKMDNEVFTDKKVKDTLAKHFVPIRVTESSDNKITYKGESVTEKQFTAMSQVQGFPTLVFMDSQGKELGKIPGFIPAEEMNSILAFITTESYKTMDFQTYKQKSQKS